jgi:branched-chain amino acid transport system substrate-binding protein
MNGLTKAVAVLAAAVAVAAAGCEAGPSTGPAGGETIIIGVDLPFQGVSKDASDDTWNALRLYLEQVGGKAGDHPVQLRKQDNSTAAKGAWDDATCTRNATQAAATENQVAVIGTYNSGCAKLEAPILNQAPGGPMLMVSHANTSSGLTRAGEVGEPEKYFPSGKRSYARVITTDDVQGSAAAQFAAQDLKVSRCFVLNDTETAGKAVADAFAGEAREQGIEVVGEQAWHRGDANYVALFGQAKAAGADCVFLGGNYGNNGGQLTRDKVAVLGDNTTVKLLAPDGFIGYPDFIALTESDGAYLTYPGLPIEPLTAAGGGPAAFVAAYATAYGNEPRTSYALYGVAALQVILAAIERSDATRAGVCGAVFGGAGISIPADQSVLGKEIAIDPSTGDVSARDVAIEHVTAGMQSFHKAWSVS